MLLLVLSLSIAHLPPFLFLSIHMRMSAGQQSELWASFAELSIKCGRLIPQRTTTRVKGNFRRETYPKNGKIKSEVRSKLCFSLVGVINNIQQDRKMVSKHYIVL